jgi:hypothetical protein
MSKSCIKHQIRLLYTFFFIVAALVSKINGAQFDDITVEIKACIKALENDETDQSVAEGVAIRLGCLIVKIEDDRRMFELAPSLLELIIKSKKCGIVKIPDWLLLVEDYQLTIKKMGTADEVDPPFTFGRSKNRFLASFAEYALRRINEKRHKEIKMK